MKPQPKNVEMLVCGLCSCLPLCLAAGDVAAQAHQAAALFLPSAECLIFGESEFSRRELCEVGRQGSLWRSLWSSGAEMHKMYS
jgi:hypothetical protein